MEETCNLGDMYSYYANSTVNTSGVAGNHRSWNIFICHKNQVPLRDCSLNMIIFMYCYLSTDVKFKFSIKFLTCISQSLRSPINSPTCMMGDGDTIYSAKLYDMIV